MIRLRGRQALVDLPRAFYGRESLQAGALAVAGRCEVLLERRGAGWLVRLKFASRAPAAVMRKAAGDFLNEALSSDYRQRMVRFHRPLAVPVFARILEAGFPAPRPDPLEELEPQVRRDRETDTELLLARAREIE